MRRKMTWWRNLGGLLAACVLTLLVVGPTVGAGLCLCDASVAISGATAQAVQGDAHGDIYPCDAACCQGGHCHQGGPMLDALIASIAAPVPVVAEHAPAAPYALASRTTTGPDRPPRA